MVTACIRFSRRFLMRVPSNVGTARPGWFCAPLHFFKKTHNPRTPRLPNR